MKEEIQKNLFRLYSKQGIKFETLKEMFDTTKINPSAGLYCNYCAIELELSDSENELKRLTLDHRVPKYWGGKNEVDNLVPCCNLCNTIKSTMFEKTYNQFLIALEEYEIKDKVFKELFPGQKNKKLAELI